MWSHLIATTLGYSVQQTLLLMAGVASLTLVTGAGTAWLVTMYRFPGRALFDWLLILPLGAADLYYRLLLWRVSRLYRAGPDRLRHLAGFTSYQDYWFPHVRSLGGAVFIMAAVLYPYVYLTARASFALQSVHVLEVARTLGRTGTGALFAVALPMARPALAAGVSLALMECLNDIGAVEYLGVQTLTSSIYAAWIQRSSLSGAAQLALVMFVFIVGVDRAGTTGPHIAPLSRPDVATVRCPSTASAEARHACVCACAFRSPPDLPCPFGVLVAGALAQGAQYGLSDYAGAARNSLLLAFIAAAADGRPRIHPRGGAAALQEPGGDGGGPRILAGLRRAGDRYRDRARRAARCTG